MDLRDCHVFGLDLKYKHFGNFKSERTATTQFRNFVVQAAVQSTVITRNSDCISNTAKSLIDFKIGLLQANHSPLLPVVAFLMGYSFLHVKL